MSLEIWQRRFEKEIKSKEKDDLQKAGSLTSIIPSHEEWDNFIFDVKQEWRVWFDNLEEYPHCLIVLFTGIAFFEYSEKTFWPHFAEVIGWERISINEQVRITQIYSLNLKNSGLKILEKGHKITYVGTAVFHAGIPLSLWNDFLEICEWALWHENWNALSDTEWANVVQRLFIGITRLKAFLIDNRDAARIFIQEMLGARKVSKDDNFTISELAKLCFLRTEYFEEVPETLEFLRPNSEVGLDGCARLFWNDRRGQLGLFLPSVERSQLPAVWQVGNISQAARSSPHEIAIDSEAFKPRLKIKLIPETGKEDIHYLTGLRFWALFDISRGGMWVNIKRDNLPLGNYLLVSREKIEDIKLIGFDEQDNSFNEKIFLKDGSECFITRLWPNRKYAEIIISHVGETKKVVFRRRAKIESRFFIGRGSEAGNFIRLESDKVKIEGLPVLYISLPKEYFSNNEKELEKRFHVLLDERVAGGNWVKDESKNDNEKDFYEWQWGRKPFLEQKISETGKYKGLGNIDKFFYSPDLKGEHTLSISALPGFYNSYKIFLDHKKVGINRFFYNLPGEYLLWFLICQSPQGMKWEEIMFAKEVIAPETKVSNKNLYGMLKKYSDMDFIVPKGKAWFVQQSIVNFICIDKHELIQRYCGDPTIIWSLYRKMFHEIGIQNLGMIEVRIGSSGLPYLQMKWRLADKAILLNYLKRFKVKVEHLWKL